MTIKRKITYVTGTRADFGLMKSCLMTIESRSELDLSLVVTNQHLLPNYGNTFDEIKASGLRIAAVVEVDDRLPTGVVMARNIAMMIDGMVTAFVAEAPDIVLLLGDRGEMLAAAIAAIHLNIPIAHIHGGERSGTVDEPVRHAISKLSHFHFAATDESRERLVRMGEDETAVFVVGAPGLDGLQELAKLSKAELVSRYQLDPARPIALVLYHPVLQEASDGGKHAEAILQAVEQAQFQIVALAPNSDAGSAQVRDVLMAWAAAGRIVLATHMVREEYVSFLRICDVLVGNSSSGIIEAATFGTPVLNIGRRQHGRQRSSNVIDLEPVPDAIVRALALVRRRAVQNIYGDGHTGVRIADLLSRLSLDAKILNKINSY